MALKTNEFFDINKLPTSPGVLFFGISMSRIGNAQSAEKCFEYMKFLASKIQYTEGTGMNICYGDYLYFHSDEPARNLRDRFKELMISHKNAFKNLLIKEREWTLKAFSFFTFGQVILDNSDSFQSAFQKIKEFYSNDIIFRKYVLEDSKVTNHNLGDRETVFILEEITIFYLAKKGVLKINNYFVNDFEKKWVLLAYPGKPLKSEVYLFQKNPLNLSNPNNIYENSCYDLEAKVLYDFLRLDIDTFDFSE